MNGTLRQWFEQNPLGTILGGVSAFLVVVGLVLTFAWSGAADSGVDPSDATADALPSLPDEPDALGPLSNYQVVNNRPLFNDTRRPIAIQEIEVEPEEVLAVPEEQGVSAPPRVRLTGVVITPEERIVTLTPENGGEALVIRQGMPLEGEYFGWTVGEVRPRGVDLRSDRGQSIQVELAVHDRMIAEPPKPRPSANGESAAMSEGGAAEGDAPAETRSRADEIRERIRQRREQLRDEAQQNQRDEEDQEAARRNAYRNAIQSLMKPKAPEGEEGDGEDE